MGTAKCKLNFCPNCGVRLIEEVQTPAPAKKAAAHRPVSRQQMAAISPATTEQIKKGLVEAAKETNKAEKQAQTAAASAATTAPATAKTLPTSQAQAQAHASQIKTPAPAKGKGSNKASALETQTPDTSKTAPEGEPTNKADLFG